MLKHMAFCVGLLAMAISASAAPIVFPSDPRAVIDVKRDCGAKGDGVADDTAALQAAIERVGGQDYTRFIYLPSGTYRITRTLVFRGPNWQKIVAAGDVEGSAIGPWLFGQDRDQTIIKLDDGAEGFGDANKPLEAIRAMSRKDNARMNADFFDRTIVNLTIDTGNNPGAIGIKFYSNNTGEMRDVTIRGHGAVGLDMGFCDQNGPLLIQDVDIDGFAVGISTDHPLNMQTLSRVTVRNASKVGLLHRGQTLAVEALHIIGAPLAVDLSHDGVLSLVDSTFEAPPGAAGPAIRQGADTYLYAARVSATGFGSAIEVASDIKAGNLKGPNIDQYASNGFETLGGPDVPKSGLQLKPPQEPVVAYPTRAEDWVCANDFGAKAGDEGDDSIAIQQAVDAAAAKGASTVYLLGGKTGDPNWYHLDHDVRIHGSVQRIMGFGFARVLSGDDDAQGKLRPKASFIVDEDANGPKVVAVEYLHAFGGPAATIEVRTPGRTLVCRGVDETIRVGANCTAFLSNCVGDCSQEAGSTVWARHWNTEGAGRNNVGTNNNGGTLWILGLKTEGNSTKVSALNGGKTEVLGVHNYNTTGPLDDVPFALVENATMSISGYREINYAGKWWNVPVLAKLNGQTYRYPQHEWETWSLLRIGQ